MERLVTDAEKLNKKFKATRDENGKVALTFADIVDAIHIVQQNLGITGTSAEEASTTITGSLGSVKASWKDLLTAMGRGSGIDKSLDNFTQSVKKFGGNIKPTLETSLKSLVKVVADIAPSIAEELPKLVIEITPTLFKAGADIVGAVGTGIYNTLGKSNFDKTAKVLTDKVNTIIGQFDADKSGKQFSDVLNKVINAGFNIASTFDYKQAAEKLTDWSNSALKNLDVAKLGQTVSSAWKGVWDFIGTALGNIDWENIGNKISEFINNIDWNGILHSMFKAIGELIKGAPELLKGVVESLDFENAAGLFGILFAPKMAKSLLSKFTDDSGVASILGKTGTTIGSKIAAKASASGHSFGTTFAAGTTAFFVGWKIGSLLYNTFQEQFDWWGEKLGKVFASAVTKEAEKAVKRVEEAMKKSNTIADKYEKMGYKIDRTNDDTLNRSIELATAQQIKKNQQKQASTYIPTVSERLQQQKINAGYSAAYSAVSQGMLGVPTSALNQQAKIYLDTGKLVGGTGNARAQQTNYAKRGYAT